MFQTFFFQMGSVVFWQSMFFSFLCSSLYFFPFNVKAFGLRDQWLRMQTYKLYAHKCVPWWYSTLCYFVPTWFNCERSEHSVRHLAVKLITISKYRLKKSFVVVPRFFDCFLMIIIQWCLPLLYCAYTLVNEVIILANYSLHPYIHVSLSLQNKIYSSFMS